MRLTSCPEALSTTLRVTPLVVKSMTSLKSVSSGSPLGRKVASTNTKIESFGRISNILKTRAGKTVDIYAETYVATSESDITDIDYLVMAVINHETARRCRLIGKTTPSLSVSTENSGCADGDVSIPSSIQPTEAERTVKIKTMRRSVFHSVKGVIAFT